MCLFHKWVKVTKDNNICGQCYKQPEDVPSYLKEKYPDGWCPHSFKVCVRCGKAVGFGSHGKLTLIPDGCKEQIEFMRKEVK